VAVEGDWQVGSVWETLIKWVVPVEAIVLLVWWLWLSATVYAPDTWYDPTNPFSIMTCLVQWGIVMGAFYGLNSWINRRNGFGLAEQA